VSNFRGGPASGEEYGTGSPGVIAFLFATSYNEVKVKKSVSQLER